MVDGAPCEVVVATTKDLMGSGFASTLEEGVFVLGTGTNGACEAMVGLGAVVFGLTQFAAWGYRLPGTADGRFKVPEPGSPFYRTPDRLLDRFFPQKAKKVETETAAREDELTVAEATRSPNFSLLFVGSLGVCMTGLPFMQLSKFMVNDMFGVALGAQAALIAASLPGMVGNANASGRAVWGPIGDRIGVDKTYMLFGATVPALMLCPFATSLGKTHAFVSAEKSSSFSSACWGAVVSDPDTAVLLFQASAVGTVGVFAGLPVMLPLAANEIFGKTHGGKIYQKLWFSVPLANMVGTNIVSRRKDAAYNDAAADLAAGIDESAFTAAFGAPKAELGSLLVRRTIRC